MRRTREPNESRVNLSQGILVALEMVFGDPKLKRNSSKSLGVNILPAATFLMWWAICLCTTLYNNDSSWGDETFTSYCCYR